MAASQTPPPYVPAPHLVAGSLLTPSQLVAQFEDFRNSLRHVSTAPEHVFERLTANLNVAFASVLELERQKHATALQISHDENTVLRLSNDKLKEELLSLKEKIQTAETRGPGGTTGSTHGNPIIGNFSTNELRTYEDPRAETWRVVPFDSPYSAPPGLPMGLTVLDIFHTINPRVKAYASKIMDDRFDAHIDSWGDTILYSANCTWLEVVAKDPYFQFGTYDTGFCHTHYPHNESKITFGSPYPAPPIVVVWLAGFELGTGKDFRIRTYATNVTENGFTIHIDTWGDSVLNAGISSWVAYPANRVGIYSGHLSTLDLSSERSPTRRENNGYEMFGRDVFTTPPRVIMAIDSFDMTCKYNIRLSTSTSSVSAVGMKWHISTWTSEGGLYSAGVSYIALS